MDNLLSFNRKPSLTGERYLPEVDGLRAIAVISVILFHFEFGAFSGGYVGVDIFFVISGYLITSQILNLLDRGEFSFIAFYMRRIRRLVPAFVAMMIFSFILAYTLLHGSHFINFVESAIYSVFSLSNVFFFNEVGYFDTRAEFKPLLHTWSLSVEEQLYLVWPAFLAALFRLRFNVIYIGIVIVAGASLLLSDLYLSKSPEAVFYLPFFRVYEFALGAMCIPLKERFYNNFTSSFLFGVGLLIIGSTIFGFDGETDFPGYNALLPCIGAMLVIIAGSPIRVGRLLDNGPVLTVGLASYSLYLFHWPVLVYWQYYATEELSATLKCSLITLTFMLGFLSYKFIECPVRYRAILPDNNRLFFSYIAFVAIISSVSLSFYWKGDWRVHVSNHSKQTENVRLRQHGDRLRNIRMGTCHINPKKGAKFDVSMHKSCLIIDLIRPNYLVLGDSHAADLWFSLSNSIKDINFLQMTGAGCRPNLQVHVEGSECYKMLSYMLSGDFTYEGVDGVILSWRATKNYKSFENTVNQLLKINPDLKVVIVGPTPEFKLPVPMIISELPPHRLSSETRFDDYLDKNIHNIDSKMSTYYLAKGITYISRLDLFCPDRSCPVIDGDGLPLFVDGAHWSDRGAKYFGRRWLDSEVMD